MCAPVWKHACNGRWLAPGLQTKYKHSTPPPMLMQSHFDAKGYNAMAVYDCNNCWVRNVSCAAMQRLLVAPLVMVALASSSSCHDMAHCVLRPATKQALL